MIRIPRKDKKILRSIILCHTGNPKARKERIKKQSWLRLKKFYLVWFNLINKETRQDANQV